MHNPISRGRLLLLGLLVAGGLGWTSHAGCGLAGSAAQRENGSGRLPGLPADRRLQEEAPYTRPKLSLDARWDTRISLDFPEPGPISRIYRALGDAVGVDIRLDPQLSDEEVAAPLKDVRARDVLEILMTMAGHLCKVLDEHTLLIADDAPPSWRTYDIKPIRPARSPSPPLKPRSDAPISLDVPEPRSIMSLYRALGAAFGINVLFDPQLRDQEVAVPLKNVRALDGLEILTRAGHHFYAVVDDHTILIAADQAQHRRQYDR